jgi:hypothetical protein
MTATILAVFGKAWPFLIAAVGVIFGMFRHQQAKATSADAGRKVAEAQTVVAQVTASAAKSNADAAQAGAAAIKERTNVENEIAAMPAGGAAERLRNDWSRD